MSFGSNYYGQLGLGDYTDRYAPTLISNLNNVIDISLGFYHSLFLLSNKYKI